MTGRPPSPAQRILVVGCPGAGKTTFSRWLAGQTGLPVRHLDDEYWGPGWARPRPEAWLRRQDQLTAAGRWIIDGNYLPTMAARARRADLVIMLDTATMACLAHVLRRALRVKLGHFEALPERVRAQAQAGQAVQATKDILPLVRMIARFSRHDRWRVIATVAAADGPALIVAVGPGRARLRARLMRRALRRRGIGAEVRPLPEAARLARAMAAGQPAQGASR